MVDNIEMMEKLGLWIEYVIRVIVNIVPLIWNWWPFHVQNVFWSTIDVANEIGDADGAIKLMCE